MKLTIIIVIAIGLCLYIFRRKISRYLKKLFYKEKLPYVLAELRKNGIQSILSKEDFERYQALEKESKDSRANAKGLISKTKDDINTLAKSEKNTHVGFDPFGIYEMERDANVEIEAMRTKFTLDRTLMVFNLESQLSLMMFVYENLLPEVRNNQTFQEKLRQALEEDVAHFESKKKQGNFFKLDVAVKTGLLKSLKLPEICDPYIERMTKLMTA